MKLSIIKEKLNLIHVNPDVDIKNFDVSWGYCSDLLSDVIANIESNYLWITIQKHPNIIAVATLKDIAGIILSNNTDPDPETIIKASENDIPIFKTTKSSFEISGEIYKLITENKN
ncbi:MAG: DRTGG domain-containing protein [Spirochaetes bacterium]|nr:DRTGG domain-containing protein [Spirochaetota bacterium]